MARLARQWSDLRSEIYRLLGPIQQDPFFTPQLLLDVFNAEKDMREMELQEAHEGFSVHIFYADLTVPAVGSPNYYSVPVAAGRIKRVIRNFSDGTQVPLRRDEHWTTPQTTQGGGGGTSYLPTYRLIGPYIELSPPPSSAEVNGLVIEMEAASDSIASDTDVIPAGWPLFAERLLCLDTAIGCFDVENAQSGSAADGARIKPALEERRARYEARWLNYIETRSFGPQYAVPYRQGA